MLSKFAKLDRLILMFAVVITAGLCILLFNEDLFLANDDSSTMPVVGKVEQFQSDARKKTNTSFVWRNIRNEMEVHQQDSLFTGENSKLTIALNDGSKLSIQENSLITLKKENGQILLDLKFGRMTGELSQSGPLTVRIDGQDFELQNDGNSKSKIDIEKTPLGQLEAKSSGGSVLVKNKAKPKERILLSSQQKMTVGKDGSVKEKSKPNIIVTSSPTSPWFRGDGSTPIHFAWTGQNLTQYQIRITPVDLSGNKKQILEKTLSNDHNIPTPEAGEYTWTIEGIDDTGKVVIKTKDQKLIVDELAGPKFVNWEANKNFEIKPTPAGLVYSFPVSWESAKDFKQFTLQISKSESFDSLVFEKDLTSLSTNTPNLEGGKYFFRLRGKTEKGVVSSWDVAPLDLNLAEHKLEKPLAPRLAKSKVIIDLKAKNRNPAQAISAVLKWIPQGKTPAQAFHLEVSNTKDFAKFEKYESKSTEVLYSKIDGSKKYFRVAAEGEENLMSPYSTIGEMTIDAGNPILEKIENKMIRAKTPKDVPPEQKIQIAWNEIPLSKAYQVQISTKDNFEGAEEKTVTSTKDILPIKSPGKYHVRVRAIASDDQPITEYSEPESFEYEHILPLEEPILKEPLDKATVFLQTDGAPFVWLEWTSLNRAQTYLVQVSTDPDFKKIVASQHTKEFRFLVKEKVPYGKIYWRVKAYNETKELESNWTATRVFQLFHKSNTNRFAE